MHTQVDPTDQGPENDKKPLFWLFGSFKNAFLRSLNDPIWPGNAAQSWKTYSAITICNIKSIQQTKLKKTAKNLFFGSLDHSKMHFSDFWMIQLDLVTLPKVGKHLVLSQYAISSRSNRPKSKKRPKTYLFGTLDHSKMHFCDFWMILHDLVLLPKVEKHLVPSKYAISSRSNRPNSIKWPKTSILALWIIQKCIFLIFQWSFTTW